MAGDCQSQAAAALPQPYFGSEPRPPVYDPAVDASPAGLTVTCTCCGRSYTGTPWDDFYVPADHLNWTLGRVCFDCLIRLPSSLKGKSS